jgi:hypothetical protein
MLGSVNVKNTEHERLKMRAVFFRGTRPSLKLCRFRLFARRVFILCLIGRSD